LAGAARRSLLMGGGIAYGRSILLSSMQGRKPKDRFTEVEDDQCREWGPVDRVEQKHAARFQHASHFVKHPVEDPS
jgi:hypothetical protein